MRQGLALGKGFHVQSVAGGGAYQQLLPTQFCVVAHGCGEDSLVKTWSAIWTVVTAARRFFSPSAPLRGSKVSVSSRKIGLRHRPTLGKRFLGDNLERVPVCCQSGAQGAGALRRGPEVTRVFVRRPRRNCISANMSGYLLGSKCLRGPAQHHHERFPQGRTQLRRPFLSGAQGVDVHKRAQTLGIQSL